MLRSIPGSVIVISLLALGLIAAGTGVWFQWQQTRRCLSFYGTKATEQISNSQFVELWQLRPSSASSHTGQLEAFQVEDITTAKGLVHLRRGLVEDANFHWVTKDNRVRVPLPDAAWDVALVFDTKQKNSVPEKTVVVIDFVENSQEANLTVAGRPGRVALVAEMAKGLKTWVESTMSSSSSH